MTFSVPYNGNRQFSISRSALLLLTLLVMCTAFISVSSAQQAFTTSHSDNQRTGANTSEIILTPSNVNKNQFGRLFNYSIDYQALAQPLYVPHVPIPGLGTHNVVYVATMANSVYAFDADSNQGANAAPLWHVNFNDPANGITTASVATGTLPCASTETAGPGFTQEGIVSTPVIDLSTDTLYVVAKTLENGTVRHRLHALNYATGQEKFGGPTPPFSATSISNAGHVMTFNSLHQLNRPGLLLANGMIYIAFGSNYCNDSNTGWVLAYDAATLARQGVFNTSPDHGLVSIWQTGAGLGADAGTPANVYAETAESSTPYDVPSGGQTYANSVLKFAPDLTLTDYFTPYDVAFLNSHDLDLSIMSAMVLPDQNGPYPHELITGGKQGFIYVLNRDSLGTFSPDDSLVVQKVPARTGETDTNTTDVLFSNPAYWNNTVYFSPLASPILAYPLSAGLLGTPVKSATQYSGGHSPAISANGNLNGILWTINGAQLDAYDAVSLKFLYGTNQAANGRDKLPPIAHFATQTVANGKVYVATRTTLEVYGLIAGLTLASGGNQSAPVFSNLPIGVQASDPYTGAGIAGVIVTFSDGGKGGVFNPTSAVTGSDGSTGTTYTLPKKSGTYTLTISSTIGNITTTETALPLPTPVKIISYGGAKQTATVGTTLPKPIVAQAQDLYNNGVPGVKVAFGPLSPGVLTPTSAVTDSKGLARTSYQLPTQSGTYSVKANVPSISTIKTISFAETAAAGAPASIAVTGGNNQTGAAGSTLPVALTVVVRDQYNNPVPNASVTFSDGGVGGSFSYANPVLTSSTGIGTQIYTLPAAPGTYAISAAVSGVANPANFTETGQ